MISIFNARANSFRKRSSNHRHPSSNSRAVSPWPRSAPLTDRHSHTGRSQLRRLRRPVHLDPAPTAPQTRRGQRASIRWSGSSSTSRAATSRESMSPGRVGPPTIEMRKAPLTRPLSSPNTPRCFPPVARSCAMGGATACVPMMPPAGALPMQGSRSIRPPRTRTAIAVTQPRLRSTQLRHRCTEACCPHDGPPRVAEKPGG